MLLWRCMAAALASGSIMAAPQPPIGEAHFGAWGFDASGMDSSVRPGDDFFSYANGAWVRLNTPPPDRTSIGAFPDIRYAADDRVRSLLESPSVTNAAPGTPEAKLNALYKAYTDEKAVEARGTAPLAADLNSVRSARSREDIAYLMGQALSGFHASIFDLDIGYDQTEPTRFAIRLGQGGLSLPDRDYYLQPAFAAKKAALQAYVEQMLSLAGWSDPHGQSLAVTDFESRIAAASWTDAYVRDSSKNVRPTAVADLDRVAPHFPWRQFLEGAGLAGLSRVILVTDTSLPRIADVFEGTPLETLKAWEAFRTADAAAPYLPKRFVDANFAFHSTALMGRSQPPMRWRRGVDLANTAMGSAVGKVYVAKYLTPATKAEMASLVGNLQNVLHDRIQALTWMEPPTKAEALRKLAGQRVQVGYPAVWRDYSKLVVRPYDLYGDVVRARAFDWNRRVGNVGAPWDPSEWRFWPQYPTAYGENRELIFTAGMLQPPFFDPKADPAVNYGAIGAVIGHELTHNYDDRGRQEDAEIRLRNWWTPIDAARFKERADRLSRQYSAMEPLPGFHLKGDVTLGENIADLGGVTIALAAYHASLHGRPAPVIDGYTGDQRFFLSWAQAWREQSQPDALRKQITSDLHSPATARVDGVVRNIDAWYAAFDVKPDQALYLAPAERVRIW